jgi:hypothetical protein
MHTQKHTEQTKAKISEKLKEQRQGGLSDLHRKKISETKQHQIEALQEYYTLLEREN